ncbi:uncharacterized protein LOC143285606 [Babylonia areolata]|uniref:uncharacterized protein LOC143285606 n=1 Tax=Babylonia areolata TaxID=304850 RepID=UPI003FD1B27F
MRMGDFTTAMTTMLVSDTWHDNTTAETPDITTERSWRSFTIHVVGHCLWTFLLPVILVLGVFGNVMTIVIMRRIKSDDSTINIYFTAIAVMDTVYLCNSTLEHWTWHQFRFGLSSTHSVVCKVLTWLYTGGSTISCWYLVCMTVHRAISVVWPHRVNLLCTRRTVLLLLAGITVFFAVLYSHYLIGFETVHYASDNNYWCTVRYDNDAYIFFIENVFTYIELSFYCLLPFIFLLTSNIILIWKLTVSVKAADKHLTQGDSDQVQAHRKAANSVTLTVVAVSVAFVVLTLPTSINFMRNYFGRFRSALTSYERATEFFIDAVTGLLGHANHAVNFYLYCLTGRRFREEFIKVLCCGRNRRRRGIQQ